MNSTDSMVDARSACIRSIHLMTDGALEDFADVIADDAVNRESADEPPAARGTGPGAFLASAQWLRSAFDDLSWEVHEVIADGDLVCAHVTMSGRHTRPFVVFGPDATPRQAFPPTGRTFAVTQTHWFRTAGGKVIEHWANRDDQGQALQLGWIPPSPAYLIRMGAARRRAARELKHPQVDRRPVG